MQYLWYFRSRKAATDKSTLTVYPSVFPMRLKNKWQEIFVIGQICHFFLWLAILHVGEYLWLLIVFSCNMHLPLAFHLFCRGSLSSLLTFVTHMVAGPVGITVWSVTCRGVRKYIIIFNILLYIVLQHKVHRLLRLNGLCDNIGGQQTYRRVFDSNWKSFILSNVNKKKQYKEY